ncbi:MAG: hypothetical protein ACYTE8_09740 [Planctomycetota bacterium]|jgi:hypothetical protein
MKELPKSIFLNLLFVFIFGVSLAYFEASVVVYLRAIFYPDGFTFPLSIFELNPSHRYLLMTEIGREAASIILIASASWLFAKNARRRLAHFLIIFAVWDIFYYVWLKILLGWPAAIMDWDILFFIPVVWASPVLAPVLVSFLFLLFAGIILYRDYTDKPVKAGLIDWIGFLAAAIIVVVSFCIGGSHVNKPDYDAYFSWLLFGAGCLIAVSAFIK